MSRWVLGPGTGFEAKPVWDPFRTFLETRVTSLGVPVRGVGMDYLVSFRKGGVLNITLLILEPTFFVGFC